MCSERREGYHKLFQLFLAFVSDCLRLCLLTTKHRTNGEDAHCLGTSVRELRDWTWIENWKATHFSSYTDLLFNFESVLREWGKTHGMIPKAFPMHMWAERSHLLGSPCFGVAFMPALFWSVDELQFNSLSCWFKRETLGKDASLGCTFIWAVSWQDNIWIFFIFRLKQDSFMSRKSAD